MGFQKTGKAEQIGEAMRFADMQHGVDAATADATKPTPACKRTGMHMVPAGETKCKLCGEETK